MSLATNLLKDTFGTLQVYGSLLLKVVAVLGIGLLLILGLTVLADAVGWNWPVALRSYAQVLFAIVFFTLLVVLSPIAIATKFIPGKLTDGLKGWVDFALGLLIGQICLAIAFYTLPLETDTFLVLAVFILSILFGLMGGFKLRPWAKRATVFIAIVMAMVRMAFPREFDGLSERIASSRKSSVTCDELARGEVHFFDREGNARIWYWRSPTGELQYFDRPGTHPQFGDELKAIQPPVVAEALAQCNLRSPSRVLITRQALDQGTIRFFGAAGEPRIWYWRDEDGRFEFFDRPGYHPVRGVLLEEVSTAIIPAVLSSIPEDGQSGIAGSQALEASSEASTEPSAVPELKAEDVAGRVNTPVIPRPAGVNISAQGPIHPESVEGSVRVPKAAAPIELSRATDGPILPESRDGVVAPSEPPSMKPDLSRPRDGGIKPEDD